MTEDADLVRALREELARAADPQRAGQMQAYMKSAMPFHGIQSPVLEAGSTRSTPALSPYGREFFVRKAIGWALRDHARTDPDRVRAFVADRADTLSGLSRREALRHL